MEKISELTLSLPWPILVFIAYYKLGVFIHIVFYMEFKELDRLVFTALFWPVKLIRSCI